MDILFTSNSVGDILSKENLHIPSYQRPYKWERKHIRNLFYDVRDAMSKSEYQIGSVILHEKDGQLDIVDGQQRLISISLFLYALEAHEDFKGADKLLSAEYGDISCYHAQENLAEWRNLIQLVGRKEAEAVCQFLLENCFISCITMPEDRLAEAFQLFDSQNNRGKSLEPHDLLKAYHLRKQNADDEKIVEMWESFVENQDLSLRDLFDKYLFRMKRWSRGETGLTKRRYGSYLRFTEDFIDDFKGVDLDQQYPYLELYRQLDSLSDGNFPLSLTMPIIDGEKFFKYIENAHKVITGYRKHLEDLLLLQESKDNVEEKLDLPDGVRKIFNSSKSRYLRCQNLFLNICILFIERFGESELTREVVETLFIWAYYPRVKSKVIYDSTLGNYAAGGRFRQQPVQKLFLVLATATSPTDFLMKIDRDRFEHYTVDDIVKEEEKKW
ncbi:protein of hypothetical function DUF262 [Streptococcus sp. DD10]|uniref:DUF262 domain-containing protein n=1 Tax=Streptococcus sp. DD10 TaxID=1777878 RepID=UPI000795BCAD|nr:DUF262 domain-containing protein [Streptococcus sp. DD10]KXT72330.1 protein of hypothetical function DUF262 [Streptococcus sp. DD10]